MRVLLADDHQIVRDGLRSILDGEPGVTVVAEAADGTAAVAAARTAGPDVVLMDLTMPGLNGIEATRSITAEMPHVRVLCLSMHAGRHMVSAALRAGAAGYLVKECAAAELTNALRVVTSNRMYLCPSITGGVVQDYVAQLAAGELEQQVLTTREREVLQLIAEGYGTKEIGVALHISAKTVATHRAHIMAKLDLHSVAALTKYAIRRGITTVEPRLVG
jgi:DNA-binding NarL/FixJ family response regulator